MNVSFSTLVTSFVLSFWLTVFVQLISKGKKSMWSKVSTYVVFLGMALVFFAVGNMKH